MADREKWEPKIAAFFMQLVQLCRCGSGRYEAGFSTRPISGLFGYPVRDGSIRFLSWQAFNRAWTGCWLAGATPGSVII